jgi:hypothetical protein
MILVAHRVNSSAELEKVPFDQGVEVDLRDHGRRIILQHDPHEDGEDFEIFLRRYKHRLIILNIKSEGIELDVLRLLKKFRVKEYFFLDVSFPALVKLNGQGVSKIAARFSEHEPLENCLALKGRVQWVWIDCFTRLPLTPRIYKALKRHFRLCLVSPELQNHSLNRVSEFRRKLVKMPVDAVCTDRADLWGPSR